MPSRDKTLEQVLSSRSDANISFRDLCNMLSRLGFEERISGGHRLFRKSGIRELINLQKDGNSAKPYQVRQVRRIIQQYKLTGES